MAETLLAWEECVQRGPDWVFVRLNQDAPYNHPDVALSASLWELMRCNLSQRIVIDLDNVAQLQPQVINQLSILSQRLQDIGGVLRLAKVHQDDAQAIDESGLSEQLPCYDCREDAVHGLPAKPR